MKLSIVTPAKKIVLDQEVEQVFIPAFKGELNILEGHAPLVSTLTTGVLRYQLKGDSQMHTLAVSWGFMEVLDNNITVLAETAERPDEIDMARAQAALEKSTKLIMSPDLAPDQFQKHQQKIERANVRVLVGGNNTKH